MTTTVAPVPSPAPASLLLHDISWETYERLLDDAGDQHIRMTYDRGDLELMPPLSEHEWWKKVIDTVIQVICREYRVAYVPYGSTPWRRQDRDRPLQQPLPSRLLRSHIVRPNSRGPTTRHEKAPPNGRGRELNDADPGARSTSCSAWRPWP